MNLYVLFGPDNKQEVFPYTAISCWYIRGLEL